MMKPPRQRKPPKSHANPQDARDAIGLPYDPCGALYQKMLWRSREAWRNEKGVMHYYGIQPFKWCLDQQIQGI